MYFYEILKHLQDYSHIIYYFLREKVEKHKENNYQSI